MMSCISGGHSYCHPHSRCLVHGLSEQSGSVRPQASEHRWVRSGGLGAFLASATTRNAPLHITKAPGHGEKSFTPEGPWHL